MHSQCSSDTNTVSTGLLLVSQSGATAFSLNSRPPGVGLELSVDGTNTNKLTLVHDRVLDLGHYNLLLPGLDRWLSLIRVDRQQTHQTPDYILTHISRIPEIQIVNNMVFPNWIINSSQDIDYVLDKLLRNPQFWFTHYHWIDARGINIYQMKYMHVLESALVEFFKWCDFVIVNTPNFMTLTEFWEWMMSCKELDEPRRARIIFFTKQQSKTYKTASAGIIPLNIAKSQKDFFTGFNSRNTDNNIIAPASQESIEPNGENNESTTREPSGSELLCIQELDKLRCELLAYNLASPDALEIETGAIIEKINNIRELLGITC